MAENVSLSAKQARAVGALLVSRTVTVAAQEVGISERQLTRWLADDAFRAALQRAQDAALGLAVRRLAGGLGVALDTLTTVMADTTGTPAGVRVRAAGLWLDAGLRWLELADLAARVEKLEVKLGKQES
jgi:hypothetical protein